VNGKVTIVCNGVDPRAMKRLNELLDRKDAELQTKVREAADWAARYWELKRHIAERDSRGAERSEAEALLNDGKLDEAGAALGGTLSGHATVTATLTVSNLTVRQDYLEYAADGTIRKGVAFTNPGKSAVPLQDVRVLDAAEAELVNFRRPHGGVTPKIPLSVEEGHVIQLTLQLTREEEHHGRWLEWEEFQGVKHRLPWGHRDVSVAITGVAATGIANSASATGTNGPGEQPK